MAGKRILGVDAKVGGLIVAAVVVVAAALIWARVSGGCDLEALNDRGTADISAIHAAHPGQLDVKLCVAEECLDRQIEADEDTFVLSLNTPRTGTQTVTLLVKDGTSTIFTGTANVEPKPNSTGSGNCKQTSNIYSVIAEGTGQAAKLVQA